MPAPKTIDVGVMKLLTQTGEETDELAAKASKPEKKENNVLSSCKNDRNKTKHCDNFAYRRQQTQTFNPRKVIIPFVSGGVINPSEELSTYSVKVNAANNNGGDVDSISAAVVDLTIFARGSENLPIGDCTNSPTAAESFGVWEEHTKGVGGKLLLRMGYQPGKGLGKKLQGISDPIQVQQRWGRGALGLPVPPVPPPLLEPPTLTKSDAAPLPVIHNFDIGHWDSKVVWNSKNSIFGSPVQQQPRKVPQRKIFQTKGFSRSKGSTQV